MSRTSKNYSDREKKQSRHFTCILYPESTEYDCQLLINRLPYYWTKFYYILHDKDRYTEFDFDVWNQENHDKGIECPFKIGDLKKPHYHVIGYSDTPCLLGRAATKFGIPSNYVNTVKKTKSAIQYLIHLNDPDKYQYIETDIQTNDENLHSLLKRNMESKEKAKLIVDYMNSRTDNLTFSELIHFALNNDCWDELRRGQHIYSSLLVEINMYNRGV